MEKKKIIIIFLICICYVLLNGCGKRENKQIAGSNIEYADSGEKNMKLDKEVFMNIQYGDSFDAFSKQIGEPSRYDGNIKKYPVYLLADGGYACVLYYQDKIQVVLVYDENDKIVYSYDRDSLSDDLKKEKSDAVIEDFAQIECDFDYRDLVMTVGEPTFMVGSGITNYVYALKDGTSVTVTPDMSTGGIFSIVAIDKDGKTIKSITN